MVNRRRLPVIQKIPRDSGFQIPVKSQIPMTNPKKRRTLALVSDLDLGHWALGIDWDLAA
jgi:hypothetical protein